MENPKVSILVPIYNVEKYLPRCIESVLSQDFKAYELILVDDGSPDQCPQICDEYAKKDSRIKVVHKKMEDWFLQDLLDLWRQEESTWSFLIQMITYIRMQFHVYITKLLRVMTL